MDGDGDGGWKTQKIGGKRWDFGGRGGFANRFIF